MIESELRRALVGRCRDVRLFVRNVGVFRLDGGRVFRAGIKGQADVFGFTRDGRAIEIEIKTKRGKLSPEQIAWRDFCLAWNVIYLLLEAHDDADPIDRWCAEIRSRICP